MKVLEPARSSERRNDAKLMIVRDQGPAQHSTLGNLREHLNSSDLLVVNDASTMPSRLVGRVRDQAVEIRLALHLGRRASEVKRWLAVSIGLGAYNTPTEDRHPGYSFTGGEHIVFGGGLVAEVVGVEHANGLLIELEFSADNQNLFQSIYEAASPIQYAYLQEKIADWDQQTIFSGPAVAVEPPSSAFHLNWEIILALRKKGIEMVSLTHATGLSTTGNDELDALLPLPELSIIPEESAAMLNAAKSANRRIISIGTGAARAIEGATMESGEILAGSFTSLVKLNTNSRPRSVSGLLSGMHEEGTSHWSLLESFVSTNQLRQAHHEASERNYLGHEYGDLELVFA